MNIQAKAALVAITLFALVANTSAAKELDENCVVNILNRTVQVGDDGGWSLPNVPSNIGGVRARASCIDDDGSTVTGQSDFFTVLNNGITRVGTIEFAEEIETPTAIVFSDNSTIEFFNLGYSYQLSVTAEFADGDVLDITRSESGISYSITNSAVASISSDGFVTAQGNGTALITASFDGLIATRLIRVAAVGSDQDGDGLPDVYENENGLDPADPIDAFEDQDGDGLSALDEYLAGTDPQVADSDGDGIADGEELVEGEDGYITSPLIADSDGDGLSDGVEITVGSDPNDNTDANYEAALVSLRSTPGSVVMTFNGIDSEVSTQLSVAGVLLDGSEFDLTSSSDTSYASSDLTIVSFGLEKGQIFGGQPGNALVTVTAFGKSVDIDVTVRQFDPVALSAVSIPGYANNVDISGDYAFVAAGSEGLQVVDVSDRTLPAVVAALDTDGTAIDIKVVGNLAYLADGEAGIKVIDITEPLAPALIGRLDTAGVAQDLAVQLSYLYVANGSAGIEVIDISDSTNPISLATLENLNNVNGIAVEQDLAVVTAGSSLVAIGISDPTSPMRLGSINIGSVKDLVLDNGYAHVAAYSQGYRVVDVSNPMLPRITGGDSTIAPRDVALTRNFAFYAEQLFPNVVAFINIFDPESPIFQGTINLSPFGDYAGTGIALDASYAYITEESYVVRTDYGSTGNTKLFIAQYRDINDNNGVPPTVSIAEPGDGSVVVEGRRVVVTAEAEDDVAVASVSFFVDGELIFTDTSAPYQMSLTVPAPTGEDLIVEATAIDLGGNTADSSPIALEIQPDADADGLGDDEEVTTWGTDPLNPDSDDDGLLDGEEIRLGTDPNDTDSDDDGIDDKTEVDNETDPLNPDTIPPTVSSITPADAATDIPENSSVTVVFAEALLPKSVTSAVLQVQADGSASPIAGSLQLAAGNTELIFVPDALMQDFTLHTVSISGVKDEAGNAILPVQFNFTTGNFVDTVRPSVVDISPSSNATDVPLNSVIDVILSEPIIPDTVTEESFYVIDRSTSQRFEGVLSVSDDKSSISFVPNSPFLVGRQYQVVLTSAIQDLFGLSLYGTSRYFTTSFESDGVAPEVVSTTIADGAIDIPRNVLLKVKFSEVISALYTSDIKLYDALGEEVPATVALSNDKKVITLDPTPVLDAAAAYVLSIDGVRDLSGNLLPLPLTLDFTTGDNSDNTRGRIASWSYASNAELPLNAYLAVEFDERIDPTTINTDPGTGLASFSLYSNTQARFVRGDGLLDTSGSRLVFEPTEPLQQGHSYTLYVTYNTYLYDLAGNLINGTSRRFTTSFFADGEGPLVDQVSIADGSTEIPVNSVLLFTTSEPISTTCLESIELSAGGETVSILAETVDSEQRTIEVTPLEALNTSTEYVLSLNGLCDYAGNELSGQVISFITSGTDAEDNIGPYLSSVTPVNNTSNVSVDTVIVLEYDEPLSQLTAPAVSGGGLTLTGTYEVNGSTVTFTPDLPLLGDTRYSINTTATDLAGNVRSSGNRYFTTALQADDTAPTVVAISPSTSAIDVSPLADVVLSFSEPMAPSTISNSNIVFYANSTIITPTLYRSANGQQVTLSANLPSESVVSVVVTDRVTDLSGNAIAPYVSSFTTSLLNSDGSRPSVSRVIPGNGTSGWLGINEVVLYVNEPLDAASVAEAFHIAEDGVLVDNEGTLEVLGNGQTIRFTKDTPFAEGALVQVYLSDDAVDGANNPLNNYSAYFTMGSISDGVGTRPYATQYSSQSNLPLNPLLRVTYSEPLDSSSLTSSNLFLRNTTTGVDVPISVSLNTEADPVQSNIQPGQIITVEPQELLAADTSYQLWMRAAITDTDGDMQVWDNWAYFSTAADAVVDDRSPMIVALNPPDGETGVGVNPYYAVRFDESVSTYLSANQGVLTSVLFSEDNRVVRYARLETLPADSEVTESLPTFDDLSGNEITGSSTFTTTAGPDLNGGSIRTVSVANGATDVALNPVLVREFSETVDPVSVSDSGVYLYDSSTGLTVETTRTLSADGKRLTLVPVEALAPGRLYYWYGSSLRDLSGNGMQSGTYRFTTGFAEDNTGPVFDVATVFDGQVEVPTNVRLAARFDEPLNPLSLDGVELVDSGGTPVVADISFSADRRTLTVLPKQLLAALSDYTLTLSGLEDVSGNVMSLPVSLTFSTADDIDNSRGNWVSWSFANNAELPLNTVLEVELSERIDPTTINTDPDTGLSSFALYSNTQGRFLAGEGVLSADGRHLAFARSEVLQAGHSYTLYVTYNTYLYDLAGNLINGTSRRFTVSDQVDVDEPTLVGTSLADGTTEVAVNSDLTILLSEPIGASSCLDAIRLTDGIDSVEISLSDTNDQRGLVISPLADLAANTEYTLFIDGLCDYAGNLLPPTSLSFTTSVADVVDTQGPILQSISPGNNVTGVALDTDIVLEYNEPVSLLSTPVLNGAGANVSGTYSVVGNTITFTPDLPLLGDTRYSINTTATDLAGNVRSSGNRYFTTALQADDTAPTVVAISPSTSAIDVSPLADVVLSFSEPMAPSTISNSNIVFYANSTIITPTLYRSANGQQVTLSANLPSESVVSVVVTDRVTDLSGNAIAPYVSSFTTSLLNSDGSRPSVSRVIPGNGTSGWLGINEVVLYVNEPLDAASVAEAFHIAEDGVLVDNEGTLEVLGNGQTIRFTKDTPFAEGALVQVYLSDDAVDGANNPLNNYSAYFTMGSISDGVGTRPYATQYSSQSNLPLNPLLRVTYSEPLDSSSLTSSNLFLRNTTTGVDVPISVSLNTEADPVQSNIQPGQIITVEPQELLAADTSYQLWMRAAITDTDGDMQVWDNWAYFSTAADAVVDDRSPMIVALNPPDGETGVGVNPYYAVRFDESVSTYLSANQGVLTSVLFSEDNRVVRYARLETLPADSEVTESLPTFDDLSGNEITGSSTFTTTAGPDLNGGSIRTVSVANGATDVALNPVLVREFSETVDPVSVSDSGVYLYDSSTGLTVETTRTLSADGKRLTLVPVEALAPGRLYYWYGSSLRDLSGNGMQSGTYRFTTGFAEDNTGPVFDVATVFDGQVEVPTNVRLAARFDEPLNPLSLDGVELVDSGGTPVVADISFSADRRTLTVLPKQLLAALSDYTLTLSGLEDVSGNVMSLPVSLTFSTADDIDNSRGNWVSWSFANNAELPLNTVLEVELSERIDPTTINTDPDTGLSSFALYSNTQGRFLAGEGVLSADGRHLAFARSEVLQAGHSYTLYVTYNTYLYDLAGNLINGTSRRFTVSDQVDLANPSVLMTTVEDGLFDVPLNANFNIKFDEAMNPNFNSGVLLLDAFDNEVLYSQSTNSIRDLFTIVPNELLMPNMTYTLDFSLVLDMADNSSNSSSISFTTGIEEDLSRGDIVDWSFTADEVLPVDTALTVVLSERVDPTTVDAERFYLWDEITRTRVPGSIEIAADGVTLSFTPNSLLEQNGRYRLYVSYSYFYDLAGNIINRSTRRFYTPDQ